MTKNKKINKYKGKTVNKLLAVISCLLMVLSLFLPYMIDPDTGESLIYWNDLISTDYFSFYITPVFIGCLIILLCHFTAHPRFSIIGVLCGSIMTSMDIALIFFFQRNPNYPNASIFDYASIGYYLFFIGYLLALVLVFLPAIPWPEKKDPQNFAENESL